MFSMSLAAEATPSSLRQLLPTVEPGVLEPLRPRRSRSASGRSTRRSPTAASRAARSSRSPRPTASRAPPRWRSRPAPRRRPKPSSAAPTRRRRPGAPSSIPTRTLFAPAVARAGVESRAPPRRPALRRKISRASRCASPRAAPSRWWWSISPASPGPHIAAAPRPLGEHRAPAGAGDRGDAETRSCCLTDAHAQRAMPLPVALLRLEVDCAARGSAPPPRRQGSPRPRRRRRSIHLPFEPGLAPPARSRHRVPPRERMTPAHRGDREPLARVRARAPARSRARPCRRREPSGEAAARKRRAVRPLAVILEPEGGGEPRWWRRRRSTWSTTRRAATACARARRSSRPRRWPRPRIHRVTYAEIDAALGRIAEVAMAFGPTAALCLREPVDGRTPHDHGATRPSTRCGSTSPAPRTSRAARRRCSTSSPSAWRARPPVRLAIAGGPRLAQALARCSPGLAGAPGSRASGTRSPRPTKASGDGPAAGAGPADRSRHRQLADAPRGDHRRRSRAPPAPRRAGPPRRARASRRSISRSAATTSRSCPTRRRGSSRRRWSSKRAWRPRPSCSSCCAG